ncbi:MAG: AmmeMemoRadiSam system radical SAM enzyme [Planctomycetota bacterium]
MTRSRRTFLKTLLECVPAAAGAGTLLGSLRSAEPLLAGDERTTAAGRLAEILKTAPRARFWVSGDAAGTSCAQCHAPEVAAPPEGFAHKRGIVKCLLCAQGCVLREGERGKCRARGNVKGELRSLVYGRPLSVHVDPIEKKPFYHYLPGSQAFSISTAGCPLRCKFCQNYEISQANPEDHPTRYTPPEDVVEATAASRAPVIAFTYNEPTVFAEYLLDIARLAAKKDLRSVLVSCGFMREEPLKEMCEVLKAIKIDLKGYSEDFYRDVSGAALQPVLRSIRQVHASGVHLEIVNLVVPTLNDSEKMLRGLADWVLGELGPDVPVHFTRFHPDYQLRNLPPTPISTLEKAREIAMEKGIRYAFVGNVPGHPGNHTYCPSCKRAVVKRTGFFVVENHLEDGKCSNCGTKIAGVWS